MIFAQQNTLSILLEVISDGFPRVSCLNLINVAELVLKLTTRFVCLNSTTVTLCIRNAKGRLSESESGSFVHQMQEAYERTGCDEALWASCLGTFQLKTKSALFVASFNICDFYLWLIFSLHASLWYSVHTNAKATFRATCCVGTSQWNR